MSAAATHDPEALPAATGHLLITRTDMNGVIEHVNQAFERASGYTCAELKGRPHSIVRHPAMPDEVFTQIWQTLSAGRAWSGVLCNRHRDGHAFWVRARVSPVVVKGRTTGYISVQELLDGPLPSGLAVLPPTMT